MTKKTKTSRSHNARHAPSLERTYSWWVEIETEVPPYVADDHSHTLPTPAQPGFETEASWDIVSSHVNNHHRHNMRKLWLNFSSTKQTLIQPRPNKSRQHCRVFSLGLLPSVHYRHFHTAITLDMRTRTPKQLCRWKTQNVLRTRDKNMFVGEIGGLDLL